MKEKLTSPIALILYRKLRSVSVYAEALLLGLALILLVGKPELYTASLLLQSAVRLVILYVVLDAVSSVVRTVVVFLYRRRNGKPETYKDNFIVGIKRTTTFAANIFFLLSALHIFLIDVRTLVTSFAIFAAFIGLVFRDYITNFVNGVSFMFSGKYRLGEYVKVGDNYGKITDITFSQVTLLTDTKDVVYVPNNIIASQQVVNLSKSKIKNVYMEIVLNDKQYPYFQTFSRVLRNRILKEFSDVIGAEKNIHINLSELDKDSITVSVEYILSTYNFELEKRLRNRTIETALDYFKRRGTKKTGDPAP